MEQAKASARITLLRGHPENPMHSRELELIRLCNELVHGQVPEAFPGAQPTSLTRQKVGDQLLQEPYLVCEKTDGERHLLLAYEGHVYFIDRKCRVWLCPVQLPLPDDHKRAPGWHHNTLLDGELVPDAEDTEGSQTCLRYLVYDAMHIFDEDLTHRTLLHRLKKALFDVILPKEQLLSLGRKDPLQLMLKDFFELWQIKEVVAIAAELPHGTDGLVFTPVMVPYAPGTCPALLKWKPADMNTVDFKLEVVLGDGKKMHVKLLVGFKGKDQWQVKFCGHWLAKTGEVFKVLKKDPKQFDGKIGECKWNPSAKTFTPTDAFRFTMNGAWEDGGWVLERLREDKEVPNDLRTAKRVVESIEDNLTEEDLAAYIVKAKEDGKLKAAASCGDGYLARVEPQNRSAKDNWAPSVQVDQQHPDEGEPTELKASTETATEKDAGKGKGKSKKDPKGKGVGQKGGHKGKSKRDKDGPLENQKDQEKSDKKGERKGGKTSDKKGEKGLGRWHGRGKGKSKTHKAGSQDPDAQRRTVDEENMSLMEWSKLFEAQQAGKDTAQLQESEVTSAPSGPEIPLLSDAAQHGLPDEEPVRTLEFEPRRPRTVADLMDLGVEFATARVPLLAQRSRENAAASWKRPRTVADLDAAKAGTANAEVGHVEVDNAANDEAFKPPLLLQRFKGLLKRRPRLPEGDVEAATPKVTTLAPAGKSLVGALGPGYVPPVLGGTRK
ncbi:unnamed protein product [Durusdinium trenchii]|uniref:mRNA guanylyltransferase n=2 Tax=Durusdinium trenchii TaxID=1381693 RepID=A0ABP0JV47_9DINO